MATGTVTLRRPDGSIVGTAEVDADAVPLLLQADDGAMYVWTDESEYVEAIPMAVIVKDGT